MLEATIRNSTYRYEMFFFFSANANCTSRFSFYWRTCRKAAFQGLFSAGLHLLKLSTVGPRPLKRFSLPFAPFAEVPPFRRKVGYHRNFQSAFVQITFTTRHATAMVTEKENDGIVFQSSSL